jgi:hypothetical protein
MMDTLISIRRFCETQTFIVLVFVLVLGCTNVKSPSAVNTFAIGLAETTTNVKESFIVIREIETLRGRAHLAASVLCRESNCPPLKGIALEQLTVTPEVTNRIFLILSGLVVYAELLVELGGGEVEVKPSASTKALGQNLKITMDAVNALTPFDVTDFAEDILKGAKSGTTSLGDFLNQDNIKENLTDTIEAMAPHIEAVAAFLIESIGSPTPVRMTDGTSRPPHGLRATLSRIQGDIGEDSALILNELRSDPKINDSELVKMAFRVYDQDIGRVIRTDFALAETQASLRQMVKAHKILRNPSNPSTLQRVEMFQLYAQRTREAFIWAGAKKQLGFERNRK